MPWREPGASSRSSAVSSTLARTAPMSRCEVAGRVPIVPASPSGGRTRSINVRSPVAAPPSPRQGSVQDRIERPHRMFTLV